MATVTYLATKTGHQPDRTQIDLGNVTTGIHAVSAGTPIKLGEGAISSLIVQNLFVNQDGTANTETVVVCDKAKSSGLELIPGQVTPSIAAENLDDIWLRVK